MSLWFPETCPARPQRSELLVGTHGSGGVAFQRLGFSSSNSSQRNVIAFMLNICCHILLYLFFGSNFIKDQNKTKLQTPKSNQQSELRAAADITDELLPLHYRQSREARALLASQEPSAMRWWLLVTNSTSLDFCSFSSPFL